MSDDLASRVELQRLARELDCAPADLDGLVALRPTDLRTLRHRLAAALDARQRPTYRKLASASTLLPDKLSAALAQRFFGPLLCGKVASSLEPAQGASLVRHLDVPFLADVSVHVDPLAAEPIIRALDDATLRDVLAELLRRGDHATVGKYISAVGDAQLRTVLPTVSDGADLLRSALAAEDASRFPVAAAMLPDDALAELLGAALDLELFAESLVLVEDVDDDLRRRVAGVALGLGETAVLAMIEQVGRADAWPRLVDVLAALEPGHFAVLAAAAGRDDVPAAFLADLAARVEPAAVAAIVADLPAAVVARVLVELVARGDVGTLSVYGAALPDPVLTDVAVAALPVLDVERALALLPADLIERLRRIDGATWAQSSSTAADGIPGR